MTVLYYLVVWIYNICLTLTTLYCVMQLILLYHYKKYKANSLYTPVDKKSAGEVGELPFITVQLPIYNEKYVIGRLIDACVAFEYPKHLMEIHVLDDSTDETVDIVAEQVAYYQSLGFNIAHIRRKNRQGFKAGALRDGLAYAKGEFVAIFDADFVPKPDFLLQTIPHFKNPKIGVVQTRWSHLNKEYSLLTKIQAMQLDMHFTVEQKGREVGNFLLQFNGTAGVWRRTTIEDAGGWEVDTLAEDLDLSYRAQLKGWRITFLDTVTSPAELPAEMIGLKSQQYRWMKGGAETSRKMLPSLWRSALPFRQKVLGTAHLISSSMFVLILLSAIVSVPLMFIVETLHIPFSPFSYLFFSGTLAVLSIFYEANVHAARGEQTFNEAFFRFVKRFPVFIAINMGLSLHNSVAVVQGYMGKKSPFVRTPKYNIVVQNDTFQKKSYRFEGVEPWTYLEALLCIYFILAAYAAIFIIQKPILSIYFLLLAFGFGTIFFLSIRHSISNKP
jgi:cellulose synthase/poly-beta-1,6-N-acetylglucosamine synthase-like glycosyltransferase